MGGQTRGTSSAARLARVPLARTILAGALFATSGCFYMPWLTDAGPAAPGEPRTRNWRIGVGASAGLLATSNSEVEPSFLWDYQVSFWLNERLGIEFDFASATLEDPESAGDRMTIEPKIASFVLSLPDRWMVLGPHGRWRLGGGAGVALLEHSDLIFGLGVMPIARFQVGAEWITQRARLFTVVDFYGNLTVEDETGVTTLEFGNLTGVRVGIEMLF